MLYVLYTLFFVSCIVLVGSVLLQPGKTDAGALFTSNISNTAFGPRGTASVLAKITIAAAVVFMFSALMISMPALTGGSSVLSTTVEESTEPAPAELAPAANTDANAATATTPIAEQGAKPAMPEGADAGVESNSNANAAPAANK